MQRIMEPRKEPIGEHILLHYLLGKTSPEENREVETWLDEGEGNRRQLDRLEALWLESGRLVPVPVAVDVDKAWDRLAKRIGGDLPYQDTIPLQQAAGRGRRLGYVYGVAAAIVLLVGIYTLIRLTVMRPEPVEWVATTGMVSDTLPDGSEVILHAGSSLIFPEKFEDNQRAVTLKGEALFAVEPEKERPFVIEAGRARIRVLGTSFLVQAYEGRPVQVTVKEGRVALSAAQAAPADSSTIILEAGMSGILELDKLHPEIAPSVPADQEFWIDSTLIFRQTELDQVFDLIHRHYGVTVLMSDSSLGRCRLTASFQGESAGMIMKVIAETFNLQLSARNNTYILSGDGCNP